MTDGDTMTDKEQIIQLYKEMYTAMVNKDRAELERVHDDSFVLVHMTGMRQPKEVYISSIMDGTLNYLFGKVQFVFIDTSASALLTVLQYLSVMVLFAYVGYILQMLLKRNKETAVQ